jgi:hypothetical protein
VDRLLNVKLVLQSQILYLFTKIHGVIKHILSILSRLNLYIIDNYFIANFTMLWINELTAVLLVQCRGEMAVLPAITAVLLHHSVVDTWTDCSVVSTGWRGNGVSACSYCSTVTSQCYGYMDRL